MATAALGDAGFGESMTGQQIYENFTNAKGPGDLQVALGHLENVMGTYQDRVHRITTLAASMEEGWTGDAAQAAQRSAGPLALAHDDAAMQMVNASQLIQSQAQAFYDTKNTVVPVPGLPPAPSMVDTIITGGSANANFETKVKATMDAAQQNVNAMNSWAGTSSDNGSRMPTTYGTLDPGALNVTMASPSSASAVAGGGMPNTPGSYGGGTSAPVTAGYPASAGTTGGTSGLSPEPAQYTTPGGYTGAPGTGPGGPGVPGGTGGPPSGGQTIGLAPVGGIAGSPGSGGASPGGSGSRLGGLGSGAGSGSGGAAASRLYGGGAPGDTGVGAGNRVGAGAPGTANESVARGGPANTTGAAGKPGTGAMGASAHGGKGKGGEDEEHQRKFVQEDDEAFQLTAEGERLIDPSTGLPVAPPVIG